MNLLNKKICLAIESRNIIVFNYEGGSRKIEPYCHGLSKNRKELLRAYQISGYSSSGKLEGWKLFYISKISNLRILDKKFQKVRPKYNPNDSAMSKIYCRV